MTKQEFDKYLIEYPKTMYLINIPEHMIKDLKDLIKYIDPEYYEWLIYELEELIDEEDIER